ncbi:MAG: creatininase family protein [Bacillota bacterium]
MKHGKQIILYALGYTGIALFTQVVAMWAMYLVWNKGYAVAGSRIFLEKIKDDRVKRGCRMLDYLRLTVNEIKGLERERTIFLMAVSPVEVHGPHLPVGTDLFIAEELQRRYVEALQQEYPRHTLVRLPALFLGADALPVKGSLHFPASLLKKTLLALAKDLAGQGFRYLFLSDNHGGPRHQLAVESAARRAWEKYCFIMVNPFGLIFRMMVENDERLFRETALAPGCCGDNSDSHAGTNETSLMLAAEPHREIAGYSEVAAAPPPPAHRGVKALSRLCGFFSGEMGRDLEHLARLLGWIGDKRMLPYLGAPSKASREKGEAMLRFHVTIAMELFRRALNGEPTPIRPLLWKLRILQHLP